MTAAPVHLQGERLLLDPSGAAFWPAGRSLIVADLHLEKASAAARRGSLLPPYDSQITLERLRRLVHAYHPERIIALGDSFHDREGAARMGAADRAQLLALTAQSRFLWIAGNHDAAPAALPGEWHDEWQEGPFLFRHQAAPRAAGRAEISGHFHPKASAQTRAQRITRPCFVSDPARLVLPAFGAYTGGLDVRHPAIARLFPRGFRVFLLGRDRLFSFPHGQLSAGETAALC